MGFEAGHQFGPQEGLHDLPLHPQGVSLARKQGKPSSDWRETLSDLLRMRRPAAAPAITSRGPFAQEPRQAARGLESSVPPSFTDRSY